MPSKKDFATHHLVKIEPESRWFNGQDIKYSIDDFKRDGEFEKVGVRNLEASRRMKEMKVGQQVLIYHSNTRQRAIVGLAEVAREAQPDKTAFDPLSPFYDEDSVPGQPIWHSVSLRFLMKFPHPVPYRLLKKASVLSGDSRRMAHEMCKLGLGCMSLRDAKALKTFDLIKYRQPSVQPIAASLFQQLQCHGESIPLFEPPVILPWRTRLTSDPELNDPVEPWPVDEDATDVEWESSLEENSVLKKRRQATLWASKTEATCKKVPKTRAPANEGGARRSKRNRS